MPNRSLWRWNGIAGVVATASYIVAILVPRPETQLGRSIALTVITIWPVLSIVYSYGLRDFIAAERPSTANRLARTVRHRPVHGPVRDRTRHAARGAGPPHHGLAGTFDQGVTTTAHGHDRASTTLRLAPPAGWP